MTDIYEYMDDETKKLYFSFLNSSEKISIQAAKIIADLTMKIQDLKSEIIEKDMTIEDLQYALDYRCQ